MTIGPHSVPRRHPAAQWHQLGDELVLLDPQGRTLRGLNGTGARVWDLIDSTRTATGIAESIAAEYGRCFDGVLSDVLAFLTKLDESSLIQVAGGADTVTGGSR